MQTTTPSPSMILSVGALVAQGVMTEDTGLAVLLAVAKIGRKAARTRETDADLESWLAWDLAYAIDEWWSYRAPIDGAANDKV